MSFLNKLLMWLKRGPPISSADTALVKYIFLDVVGFTKDRNVEAQLDIISAFNRIIKEVISDHSVPNNQLIVLPSGDGLCLALVDLPHPYDLSLVIAIDIIQKLDSYNFTIKDAKRLFQIRIGLSENVDNLITDFNGNPNVAGAGINLARAIMENADGGQILIDQNGYNTLRPREKYEGAFRGYNPKGKHGQTFNIHQYIKSGHNGLNIDTPSAFAIKQSIDPPLTKFLAYYFAHAIFHKDFFITKLNDNLFDEASVILLYFLAQDSINESESSAFDSPPRKTSYYFDGCTILDQYEYYMKQYIDLLFSFLEQIRERYFNRIYYCFEGSAFDPKYTFINEKGKAKLKKDWPEIWRQFFGET